MKRLTKEIFNDLLQKKKDLQLSHSFSPGYYVLSVKHYDAVCVVRFNYVARARETSPSDWQCTFKLSYSLPIADYMRLLSHIYALVYARTGGWFDLVY